MQGQLRRTPEIVIAGPTVGWVAEALAEMRALAALPSPSVPCITGLGGNERIVSKAAIESRMARWPEGVLLRVPGAEHELLMESAPLRDAFLSAILAMFAAHPA
jgi:lysophospholipase